MKYLFIALIKLYKLTISKLKPPCCRFYPTCSSYGIEAIGRFGAFKGGCLTLKRIARCNPFSAGGSDPVPEEYYFFRKKAGGKACAFTETDKITSEN